MPATTPKPPASDRPVRLWSLWALAGLLAACGGGGGGTSAPAPAPTPADASTPTIQRAQLDTAGVAVEGSGFGSRPQAAPLKFENFDTRPAGALPSSFGYHAYGGFGGTTRVDTTAAFSGGQALLHQGHGGSPSPSGEVEESFPHIAVRGFSSQTLYLSYRLKFRSNGGRLVQLKFNRSGMEVGGDCYGGSPKFYSSYYPVGPSTQRYDSDKTLAGGVQGGVLRPDGSRDEGWGGEAHMGGGTVLPLKEDTWYQVEEYYRLNDIGQRNGQHLTWVNGHPQIQRTALDVRSDASQLLNCSYLVIGMDYWLNPGSTNGVSVWYDDHYLDTSPARLVLANAPTWAAATQRTPLPAASWSSTRISAPLHRSGFAAGPAWLYVVDATGVVSNAWPVNLP